MSNRNLLQPSNESPPDGIDIDQCVDNYGVGIDTHSKFIQVCVLQRTGSKLVRFENTFSTCYDDLLTARDWIIAIVSAHLNGTNDFHYTIESTGTYHFPIIRALQGVPRVVNPVITGCARRKTDTLDARLLSYHDITGLWKDAWVFDDDWTTFKIFSTKTAAPSPASPLTTARRRGQTASATSHPVQPNRSASSPTTTA